MRRLRYNVAMTLDGFIADPDGGYDWIVSTGSFDFAALYGQFDTFVMGRKTFEVTAKTDFMSLFGSGEVIVFSRTLSRVPHAGVTVTARPPAEVVRELKERPGKDIWLFGGGEIFRLLADAGLVDTVEVAIMPVLLGAGIPVLPPGLRLAGLTLEAVEQLPGSDVIMLRYSMPQ